MLRTPPPHSTRNPLAVTLVEAVAAHDGTDVNALPPLAEAIDPDALNALFDSIADSADTATHLSLEYCGYTVRISADHTITFD